MLKIAVRCHTVEQRKAVIKKARGVANYDGSGAECISLDNGCHCPERYYREKQHTIIQYEEFERVYLQKEPVVTNKYQIY